MTKPNAAPSTASADLLVVNRFAISLLQQETLEDLLWSMARNLGTLMDLEDCVIYLVSDNHLVQKAAYGVKNPRLREIASPLTLPIHTGITGTAARTALPQRVDDTRADPRYVSDKFTGRSELAVPVIFKDRVIAVLDAEASEVAGFSPAQEALMVSCANIAASRIATAIEEQQRRQAEWALEEANIRLEERVAKRTQALEAAVAQLNRQATERERLQDEVLKARKLESLGILAGGLAHDFNNLLQGIVAHINQARLALRSDPDDGLECLEAAESACMRARDLTQQLQAFARGGAPVKQVQTIADVVRSTVQFALRGRPVTFDVDIADGLWPASVDASQISQVIQNLVLNAAEAMPDGGVVRVAARNTTLRSAPAIEVTVRDQGLGIPPTDQANVFDPYFTTKPDGTGLGLASAYGIVARHGGELTIDENYTEGACFRVVLQADAGATPVGGDAALEPDVPALRLVLMDDEPMVREATAGLLRRMGQQVSEAGDGEEVLALVANAIERGEPFDAVLLDLTVPGRMGGLETLRRLRLTHPVLPAAVVSGYSNTAALAEPLLHGFQVALCKPFRIDDLTRALWALADHRPPSPA